MFAVMSGAVLLPRQTAAMTSIPVCRGVRLLAMGQRATWTYTVPVYRAAVTSQPSQSRDLYCPRIPFCCPFTPNAEQGQRPQWQDVHDISPTILFMFNNQRDSWDSLCFSAFSPCAGKPAGPAHAGNHVNYKT